MCAPRGTCFLVVLAMNRVLILAISVFMGYGFFTIVLNSMCDFLKQTTFSSLSMRQSTQALYNTLNYNNRQKSLAHLNQIARKSVDKAFTPHDIIGREDPPPPDNVVSKHWRLHYEKQHWIGGGGGVEGGEVIDCPDRFCESGNVCQDFCRRL